MSTFSLPLPATRVSTYSNTNIAANTTKTILLRNCARRSIKSISVDVRIGRGYMIMINAIWIIGRSGRMAVIHVEVAVADGFSVFNGAIYRETVEQETHQCVFSFIGGNVGRLDMIMINALLLRMAAILIKRIDLI